MAKIGVNLRVTGYCSQGNRKYMEDMFLVACQKTVDLTDIEYAFCGIFDGHGGAEAAVYAKEHLLDAIVSQRSFWSDNDEDILRAIHDGFLATHYTMWKDIDKWPKTTQGLPSTAGTTATVGFIIRGKIYIGHVGDTGIALGYHQPGLLEWSAKQLTRDHKPENKQEITRIERAGGKVVAKSGVPRIVWNRPQIGHEGPVRRSTRIDEIPFLAVARSLGDFWSYNSQLDEFVVSPEPDVNVFKVDIARHKCLIFGTDGLWNIVTPADAVRIVQQTEAHNDRIVEEKEWLNPSKCLVDTAIERWGLQNMRADNTSVVVLLLDPPGPPNSNILINRGSSLTYATEHSRRPWMSAEHSLLDETEEVPQSGGLAIFRHYPQTSNVPDDGPTCSSILHGHSCGSVEDDFELGVSTPVDDDLVSSDDSNDYNNTINDLDISDTCVPLSSQPASSQLSHPHLNISTCPSQSSQGSRVQGQLREAETEAPRDEVNQRSATVLSRSSDVFNPKSPEYRRFRKRSNEERYSHCDEENIKSDEENINWIDDTWSREPKKTTQPKDETKRTLRSNTSAAKCVKTLRSRNVDLMSPCVKKSRPNDVKAVKRKLACSKTSNLKYGTKKIQQQWSTQQPRSSSKTRRGQSSANLEK